MAIAALALSLAACAPTASIDGCAPTASGDKSDAVTVTGKFGQAPKVKFTKGLSTTESQRSVVIAGKGQPALMNGTVDVDYTVYNAATGVKVDSTNYKAGSTATLQLKKDSLLPGMIKAIMCSQPGTRVVAVIPPADAFKSVGSAGLKVKGTDSLIFVFDIVKVSKPVKVIPKANGVDQKPVDGLPLVKLASNGEPTITIPKADPPTELKIQNLKNGTGTTVKSGDTVTVQYTGMIWGSGKIFDSSWPRKVPSSFATTGVIPGFGKALVGQKVGSQVIAVIPPGDGYGSGGQASAGISGTDTLVFVVDILATA